MGIIKAKSTAFGNVNDVWFQLNLHDDGYENWLYLGTSEHHGQPVDLYWYPKAEKRSGGEDKEWFSIVYGNDEMDYISPHSRKQLHRYGLAGERMLIAVEAIERAQQAA